MEIAINNDFIQRLVELNIFTHWSFDDAMKGKSWLSHFDSITIDTEVVIEGPSAFYGGNFSQQQKWQCIGGLCSMGAYSYSHSFLPSGVSVGRYSSVAKGLKVLDFSHPVDWVSSSVAFFTPEPLVSKSALAEFCDLKLQNTNSSFQRTPFDPKVGKAYPKIGNDVWIGENVTLVMGISIGHGAIVAANATVTKDVPPYSIVAGCPATIKKSRFEKNTVDRLIDSKWWDYDVVSFGGFDYQNPLKFLDQFESSKHTLSQLKPKCLKIDTKGQIYVL
ncbi:MAG: virginiamycin A acetyltransferase [Oleiphilaceae bacterium]|jgi:virginiamycin A acetyltransferase